MKQKRRVIEEITVDKYGTQADTLKFGALSINSERMKHNTVTVNHRKRRFDGKRRF